MSRAVLYVGAAIAAFVSQAPSAVADQDPWPYWDIRQFRQLTALIPELQRPRLLSTPNADSQDLWEQGQMRVHQGPWDTLLGDFTGDGQQNIAVMLAVGGNDQYGKDSAKYLLIATLDNQRWQRLLLQRLDHLLQRLDEDKAYASDTARAVDETAARAMAKQLAPEEGLLVGTSSGLNVAAAVQLALELGSGKTVATVAVDTGLKDLAGDLLTA